MKVVLDTNVFVSALLFKKRLEFISDLIEQGIIIPCFNYSTLYELKAVLQRDKFKANIANLGSSPEVLIEAILVYSLIYPDQKIPGIITEDPSDNKFLACALSSQASFIISGDQHLLRLGKIHNIRIITSDEFLKIIK